MALTADPATASPQRFVIEIIGFNEAERTLLWSTFRLTGRRLFSYGEAASRQERADLYLADADSAEAMAQLAQRAPNPRAPAVLIGGGAPQGDWPTVPRPIQWTRLFEQLDRQMQAALAIRASAVGTVPAWDGTFRRAADAFRPSDAPAPTRPAVESVLVVDDSATVRAFMRTRLAPFRFDVDYASSGEEAIDMAQAKPYTCIFLDVLMPGMDGYQVCKRIKASAATRQAAVVMLSSKSGAFDKFRGNWAGCDAYLGKPVAEDELLATIARFLPSARRVAQGMLESSA